MRVKDIRVLRRLEDKQAILEVILEDEGEEYRFVGDAWELLDENRFIEILNHWKYTVIPKRRKIARMSDEEIKGEIEKIKRKFKDIEL